MLNNFCFWLKGFFKKEPKTPKIKEFGLFLKDLRKSRNFSLRDLEKLGKDENSSVQPKGESFSYTYIFKLEAGLIENASRQKLIRILYILLNGNLDKVFKVLKQFNL